jgi:hypothetical protein|tara:strand:+ start:274 stop:867 length:594 start_codon:yes stop_codon:yes gene_type:complete
MSEMKLIMERWDKYLIKEEFDACPNQPVDADTFIMGVELAMMDKTAQKDYIEKMKKQGENMEKLEQGFTVASLLSGIPTIALTGGLSLGAAVVGVFATVINAKQQKTSDAKIDGLLKLLCIDSALLDTISNDIEKTYWTNSGIQDEVENYITKARATPTPEPMPDFTKHLVDWLNDAAESPYAAKDTDGVDTDIVMR